MSMSKADFNNALRAVISSEYSQIPCDEESIDYTFSKKFDKRMNKFIKAQGRSYHFLVNTVGKRVAVVFVVFLTLFTISMSVSAIRQPIVNFFFAIRDGFNEYFFEGDTVNIIEKKYSITELPAGYTQKNIMDTESLRVIEYENKNGNEIIFSQGISDGYMLSVDNENCKRETVYIDNLEIELYEWEYMKKAIWVKDCYVFDISFSDVNFSVEDIKKVIMSVK